MRRASDVGGDTVIVSHGRQWGLGRVAVVPSTARPASTGGPFFSVGLDLGQQDDYTGLAVAHANGRAFRLVALERTRQRSYVAVVDLVVAVLRDLAAHGTTYLTLDMVGVGRPVADLLKSRGIAFTGVAVHGGTGARRLKDGTWSIPKRDVVHGLVLAFEQRRLLVPATLPLGPALERELSAYAARISSTGHDSYAASGSEHDDLVSALSLAAWQAERLARVRLETKQPVAGGSYRSGPLQAHVARFNRRQVELPHPNTLIHHRAAPVHRGRS